MRRKTMTRNQPTWLNETCPAWCIAEHGEHDHPDDREHESRRIEAPGVILTRTVTNGQIVHRVEAVHLDAIRHRHVGDDQDWVYVGDNSTWLDLSLETAKRLHSALSLTIDMG
jgi:hypothetical protein